MHMLHRQYGFSGTVSTDHISFYIDLRIKFSARALLLEL